MTSFLMGPLVVPSLIVYVGPVVSIYTVPADVLSAIVFNAISFAHVTVNVAVPFIIHATLTVPSRTR